MTVNVKATVSLISQLVTLAAGASAGDVLFSLRNDTQGTDAGTSNAVITNGALPQITFSGIVPGHSYTLTAKRRDNNFNTLGTPATFSFVGPADEAAPPPPAPSEQSVLVPSSISVTFTFS